MSLTFYYAPMSTAGITDLVLEELGVPCQRIKVDIRAGDTRKPEFLQKNPNGKVPLIVHDDTSVWESAAITMYLGEVFGVERNLYPSTVSQRGEAMKWIVWTNVTFGDATFRFMRNTSEWTPAEQHNAKAADAAKADISNCLRILDEALSGRKFLVGTYSLADTHLNSFVDWLRHMQMDLSPYGHLNAWSEQCKARPAYARFMARG